MSLKNTIKKMVERMTQTNICRESELPHGINFVRDIAKSFPMYRVDIVFDVGANVGQSSKIFLDSFPSSHIYCFEPVNDIFQLLQTNLNGNVRVDCFHLALGSTITKGKMVLQERSEMNFLLSQPQESSTNNEVSTESIDIITLDEFCRTNKIDQINFLKIDTEGGDLEVLKGAVNMLIEQRIDFIEVEAGMNPGNNRHVPFDVLKSFLESHRYYLFGIYEQVNEWITNEPHLRRTNPLYISSHMISMSMKSE